MAQSWLRTYPLRWLDSFLDLAITPFTNARNIGTYATRGYYLLGVLSLVALVPLWASGRLDVVYAWLPAWSRGGLRLAFGSAGGRPESILLAALSLYVLVFLLKPLRRWLGEATAYLFFGAIDVGIRIGEWCLQHRWSSLFIVIGLAAFISWGAHSFYLERAERQSRVKDFKFWLDQADRFIANNPLTENDGKKYREEVAGFWRPDDYDDVIVPTGGHTHPGFALSKMLEKVYPEQEEPPSKSGFIRHLLDVRDDLKKEMANYTPREGQTDSERRAWALMNILMGRIHSRLADELSADRLNYLTQAKEYFSAVARFYDEHVPSDPEKRYQAAAHNGLGTVYAKVLLPPLQSQHELLRLCGGDVHKCGDEALKEYAKVSGEACSFDERRRENNRVDFLARVAINYDKLDTGQIARLDDICGRGGAGSKAKLAACIESRLTGLMKCESEPPFLGIHYATAAQAYGASAELMRDSLPPGQVKAWVEARDKAKKAEVAEEVRKAVEAVTARAAAAGRYLGMAHAWSRDALKDTSNITKWELCHFRFASKQAAGIDLDLATAFWGAIEAKPEPLPFPQRDTLEKIIDGEVTRKCPTAR